MTSKVSEQPVLYGSKSSTKLGLEKHDVTKQKSIDALLEVDSTLWRGYSKNTASGEMINSGFKELDALLPAGGWPLKSVIELVVDEWGSGELQILLPLMRLVSQEKKIAFVAPPYLPYAPAFHNSGIDLNNLIVIDSDIPAKDKWWCAEKMLRHSDCGLVLVWPERRYIRTWASQIRRLQVAATMANNFCIVFNRGKPVDTPVSLRLKLGYRQHGLFVEIMKSRFSWKKGSIVIPHDVLLA